MTDYKIIRSNRKTIAIYIDKEDIVVRAPYRMPAASIDKFVCDHEGWIEKKLAEQKNRQKILAKAEPLSIDDIRKLTDQAMDVIPKRVAYYAPLVGVTYSRITIRNQKTRWGSCSSKGNLNFNCLLMLAPPEVLDCVVVHELCHRKHMNHSKEFYAEVLRVFPDYYKWNGWLKENGNVLIGRMTR